MDDISSPRQRGAADELGLHYETVALNLAMGIVTPVLGAGASLYGRSMAGDAGSAPWQGAPSATELGEILARKFRAPDATRDLIQIAQWVYTVRGGAGLSRALHEVFKGEFPTTDLHEFIATVPGKVRDAGSGCPPLIVTTNYDDLIENALTAHGEAYDVLVYIAEGVNAGRFGHVDPDRGLIPITDPETYLDVDPDERTVVLKIHGFICRTDKRSDSYVITEDHYIEYLARTDVTQSLPPQVVARLLDSHLLFLGYSLRDWNVRAILHQLYAQRNHTNRWWAVQLHPTDIEQVSWTQRNVQIIDMLLEEYVPALEQVFDEVLQPEPAEGR